MNQDDVDVTTTMLCTAYSGLVNMTNGDAKFFTAKTSDEVDTTDPFNKRICSYTVDD